MIRFLPGEWLGLHEVSKEEFGKLRAPAEKAILKAVIHLEGAIKRKLQGARSGRIYRIGKRGRIHQASAPGEPPAVLYGKLRQSITHTEPMWEDDEVSAEIGSNMPYAARLEYGGVDSRGVRILPRPYIAPTVLEEEARLEAILENAR